MIGDVLTSSILCEALRKRYKNCEVHYLVNESTTAVLKNNPFIDQLVLYTQEMAGSRKLQRQLRRRLQSEGYDVTIDVYAKLGSARMARATQAPVIIGYKKWYTKGFYTHLFRYHHEPKTVAGLAIENRLKMLQAVDQEFPLAIKPKIYLDEQEIAFAKAALKSHRISPDRPVFMVSVLGSSREKTYPLESLATMLDQLVNRTNAQLLFNYIPSQITEVKALIKYCSKKTRKNIHVEVYGTSLRDFIALTSQCDALLGNEGGAINMAKALNIPTFAIFSPWIRKQAWALYENAQNQVVHLQDIDPDLYKRRSLKSIKKEVHRYYRELHPTYVNECLDDFLKENNFLSSFNH